MKLIEAISLARKCRPSDTTIRLLTGLETGLFETFLKAVQVQGGRKVWTVGGRYGNLRLALEEFEGGVETLDYILVFVDLSDVYPELTWRENARIVPRHGSGGGYFDATLRELATIIGRYPSKRFVIIPPAHSGALMSFLPAEDRWRHYLHPAEIERWMEVVLSGFANCRLMRLGDILNNIPSSEWLDIPTVFKSGWPYSSAVTFRMAEKAGELLFAERDYKKLIITDLDNTLWRGILSEDGPKGISWAAEELSFKHLLYQRCLNYMMDCGVPVVVCSKNERSEVMDVLKSGELAVDATKFSVVMASWDTKSAMIKVVLHQMNLTAGSAVFIDDNEAEIGEVSTALPEICSLAFPKENADVGIFLQRLFELFPAYPETAEDVGRVKSYQIIREISVEGGGGLSEGSGHGHDNSTGSRR